MFAIAGMMGASAAAGASPTLSPIFYDKTITYNSTNITVGGAGDSVWTYSRVSNSAYDGVWWTGDFTTGKVYAEAYVDSVNGLNLSPIAVAPPSLGEITFGPGDGNPGARWRNNGSVFAASDTSTDTFTTGDNIGCAVDFDAGTVTYYKNGVSKVTVSLENFGSYGTWRFCTLTYEDSTSCQVTIKQTPDYSVPSGYTFIGYAL